MSTRITRDTTTVRTLYTEIDTGQLNLSPKFQRNSVWQPKDRRGLILSVIRSQHIPELLLFDSGEHQDVVDGQQRLRAICDFMKDEFSLPSFEPSDDLFEYSNKYFSELPRKITKNIQGYKLNVATLDETHTPEEIGDAYRRVNGGKHLNGAELRRAIAGTTSEKVIESLAAHRVFKHTTTFEKSNRLQKQNISTKCFVISYEGGLVNTGSAELMLFVEKNKNLNLDHPAYKDTVRVFDFMCEALGGKGLRLRDGAFLDSFIVSKHLLSRFGKRQFTPQLFGDAYKKFDSYRAYNNSLAFDDPKLDAEIVSYKNLLRGDKVDRLAPRRDIIERHVLKHIEDSGHELEDLDSKRNFSENDKKAQLYKVDDRCEDCGDELSVVTAEADHIKEYSLGGQTIGENIQILCKNCHTKKTVRFNNLQHNDMFTAELEN